MRTCSSSSIALAVASCEPACTCCISTSSIWRPTLRIGLSAARGFWKIIEISRPRRLRISGFAGGAEVEAGEGDRAVGDAPGAVEDPHHRVGGHRLAGAGLADDADGLALGDGDVDVLDRAHDAAPRREFDGEIADVEQRAARVMVHVRRCGSTMSRRPSPRRLKQNTATISAAPGKNGDPPFARDHEGGAFRRP